MRKTLTVTAMLSLTSIEAARAQTDLSAYTDADGSWTRRSG